MTDNRLNDTDLYTPTQRVYRYRFPNSLDNFSIKSSILVVFSILILLGLLAAYLTFMVISLIKTSNEDIKLICPNSNLWAYMLVILISMFTINIGIVKLEKSKKDDLKIFSKIVTFIYSVSLCSWGYYELVDNDCAETNFDTTLIYQFAFVNMIIYLFAAFISFSVLTYRMICV